MIRPMSDRVVLRRHTPPETTTGGLYIPAQAQEQVPECEVVAVGPGRFVDGVVLAVNLLPGDVVLIGKWVGDEVKHDGEDLLIVREDAILAVLPPAQP